MQVVQVEEEGREGLMEVEETPKREGNIKALAVVVRTEEETRGERIKERGMQMHRPLPGGKEGTPIMMQSPKLEEKLFARGTRK